MTTVENLIDNIPWNRDKLYSVDTACIERAGVVCFDSGNDLYVNSESVVDLLRSDIEALKPRTDYDGRLAAKVTIIVKLLGDREVPDANA